MRIQPTRMLVLGAAFVVCSCGSDTSEPSSPESGGAVGTGGEIVTETGGSGNAATGGGGAANPTGGSGTGGAATGGSATGGMATGGLETGGMATGGAPPEPFEPEGKWLYLGPWEGGGHTIQISSTSFVYTGTDGDWSSTWTVTEYDNTLHHFQLVFESGTGAYSPTGDNISGTYDLNGTILTLQFADGVGAYPELQSAGSCLLGTERIVDCALYMLQP